MSRITIYDVAKAANVSASSVSRYLSDPGSIKPIAAMNIEKAIKELGYIPNTFAQSLKRGSNNTIGIVVPGLGPFFSRICSALSDFFYQHKYLLFICETGDDLEKERYYINSLIGQRVSGLLVVPSGRSSDFLLAASQQFANMVLLDRYEAALPLDVVCEDDVEGSYRLTKAMIRQKGGGAKEKDFVLLFRTEHSTNTAQRIEGARRAFAEAGLDMEKSHLLLNHQLPQELGPVFSKLFSQEGRPSSVIAYSPLILENAFIVLRKLGYDIPRQVQLGGYSLDEFGTKYQMDIPRIQQDPYALGIQAGDTLLRRMRKAGGRPLPLRQLKLEPTLLLPEELAEAGE